MANSNGWGDGSVNNLIGWGQGANNSIGWGVSQLVSASGATDIDGGNTPSNSVAPAITGTAQEGQTLTCSTGTWSGSPTYTYQWKRNGSNIGSATNSTYTLVTADVGTSVKCMVTATNFIGSSTADSNTVTPTSSTDADAQAFITAASITDPTQQSAINQLVVDLKGYSIWTKIKALYPFVGGTASQHKFNLKDPRDLDAAFRLVFSGGWTHSNTGSLPNGTNAYADTKFIPNSNTALNSYSQGFYSRTNIDSLTVDMGGVGSNGAYNMLFSRYSNQIYNVINSGISYTNSANTDSRGFYIGNRTASNVIKNYKNSSLLTTGSVASISNCNGNIWLGAFNNNGAGQYYTTRQYAFSYIGDGLTDTEAANFYTAVQAFQTTLSRNV